ncbi:MAG: hypothetical protein ACFFCQ_15460 [Promethearchaeota archaeon]
MQAENVIDLGQQSFCQSKEILSQDPEKNGILVLLIDKYRYKKHYCKNLNIYEYKGHYPAEEQYIQFVQPSNEISEQSTRSERWFNGTVMNESSTKKYPGISQKHAIIHNRILRRTTEFSPSRKDTNRVSTHLSQFFSQSILDKIVNMIHSARYCHHFSKEQDRASLLLAFISLILKSRRQYLRNEIVEEINRKTGYSITQKDIRKWYKWIREYNCDFFRIHFSKRRPGADPVAFMDCLINKMTELSLNGTSKENQQLIYQIHKRVLEIGKKFCTYKSPKGIKFKDFKFLKPVGFETWTMAIIAQAYAEITGKRGIPFELEQKKKNYISQQRCHLRKLLADNEDLTT